MHWLRCMLCTSLNAAGQPLEKTVLKQFRKEFMAYVAAKQIAAGLYGEDVIPQNIKNQIKNTDIGDKDAREILYEHLYEFGSVDKLLRFCGEVSLCHYNTYEAMQDLGRQMKEELEIKG